MQTTRGKLINFLKELGLIYRDNETNDQIKQRVLHSGAWVQTREVFLSKELVKYLIANGVKPCDDVMPKEA